MLGLCWMLDAGGWNSGLELERTSICVSDRRVSSPCAPLPLSLFASASASTRSQSAVVSSASASSTGTSTALSAPSPLTPFLCPLLSASSTQSCFAVRLSVHSSAVSPSVQINLFQAPSDLFCIITTICPILCSAAVFASQALPQTISAICFRFYFCACCEEDDDSDKCRECRHSLSNTHTSTAKRDETTTTTTIATKVKGPSISPSPTRTSPSPHA
ncbi:hypothetical protein SCHPADRAFT_200868 [Schizopora paradoxa]|uniref:Uncharacterized protein n=1 Tax=Schizopora paradoxa TaxID=27342 RepID=A0A0H2S544_9AGAM|nr:hypothetical protein SCHPADRAFT_200868 [Schizopora paradoxa]